MTNRRLIVKVEEEMSNVYNVELGTPQRGILGPLLFLLYIHDLPHFISEGDVFMYVDDTTVLVSDPNQDKATGKAKAVLQQFASWCERNHLILNSEKTVIVEFLTKLRSPGNHTFKIKKQIINVDRTAKFLGSRLDSKLLWDNQIEHVCGKLNKYYFAIFSLRQCLNKACIKCNKFQYNRVGIF